MSNPTKKTTTQTTTVERVRQAEERDLSWQEEMVVRMRQGLSEEGDHELAYRGRHHREVRARLGNLEAELLAAMHERGPLAEREEAAPEVAVDESARQRIMERLAGLKKDD